MDLSTPCVLWTKSVGSHGYPQMGHGGTVKLVHRVLWEEAYGPIPEGLTVDHGCRVKLCVNLLHYRLLTNEKNASENGNHFKTHCVKGHEYNEANTHYTKKGWRQCRACWPRWR